MMMYPRPLSAIREEAHPQQPFIDGLRSSIGAPAIFAGPYALFIYFGLDHAPDAPSSLAALLIALGTISYVAGAFIGKLNASLLLALAPAQWFGNPRTTALCGPIASGTFYGCVVLSVWAADPFAALVATCTPAVAAGWWLSSRAAAQSEPPSA